MCSWSRQPESFPTRTDMLVPLAGPYILAPQGQQKNPIARGLAYQLRQVFVRAGYLIKPYM
jgi:hypothetical protein